MKTALLVTALALPLALSCGADLSVPVETRGNERRISLRAPVEGASSLEILAFRRGDGVLASRESLSGGETALSVGTGRDYNLYLFANAPEGLLDGILYERDLRERSLSLEDDDPARPVLMGSALLPSSGGDSPLSFTLGRYLTKVTVGSVTVKWLDEWDYSPGCTISRIALMSAMGTIPLAGGPSSEGSWYNCGVIDGSLPEGVREKLSLGSPVTVTSSSPVPLNVSFYAMPNPLDGDLWGLPWSPRRTRLALELTIDGVPNWYPVDLPAMESGCEYMVSSIVITGPGSAGPDEKIERSKIELEIEVKPWDTEALTIDFE